MTTCRSSGRFSTWPRKVSAKARASAQFMCIFQLPAITALRTSETPCVVEAKLNRRAGVAQGIRPLAAP